MKQRPRTTDVSRIAEGVPCAYVSQLSHAFVDTHSKVYSALIMVVIKATSPSTTPGTTPVHHGRLH